MTTVQKIKASSSPPSLCNILMSSDRKSKMKWYASLDLSSSGALTFSKARSVSSSSSDSCRVLMLDGPKLKRIKPRAIIWDNSRRNSQNFDASSSPHHRAAAAGVEPWASMLREPEWRRLDSLASHPSERSGTESEKRLIRRAEYRPHF